MWTDDANVGWLAINVWHNLQYVLVVCLGLNRFAVLVMGGGLAATLGLYMGINFHHYVVDALSWKRRSVRTA